MHPRLEHLYTDLEKQREKLLTPLRELKNEKLNHHLSEKWSINQIIAHLIAAERLSVMYLNKKMQGAETAEDTGLAEDIKMLLLIASQRLPMKFKVPKVVLENTSQERDFKKLELEWISVRADLKKTLNSVKATHLKRKIYKHVRAGMLNIQHAVKFLREHVGHHIPQIKKQL